MLPTHQGSFRLFRFSGISVFLHWSWLVIALFQIQSDGTRYSSMVWNVAEYLGLFAIVLMHEFGHALACRSVGGVSEQIVLWPLGGIAYVNPPPRPGALLWSIAAGPLVNVALLPVLYFLKLWFGAEEGNLAEFLYYISLINLVLLGFNILPIFPLDGGQILRALLWFVLGRSRSLIAASVIGMVGAVGIIGFAFWIGSLWMGVIAIFVIMQCVQGFKQARLLARLEAAPRHEGLACPSCGAPPLAGSRWTCGNCATAFDTFDTRGQCPGCGARFATTTCPDCGEQHPIDHWLSARKD